MDYPDSPDLFEGKFTDGDPVAGISASVASADHMNAVYDELKALIVAGGIVPGTADLAQVAKSIGNQLRSKQVFDVSGTADAIILTTPAGKQPVTALRDYDEFSFIVSATNTATVTIKVDALAAMLLTGVVSDTQIFETALLTVRYISGAFYIAEQINPKLGSNVLDIAKLYTDTVDILRPGEYALDGSSLSRSDHPIAFAIVSASSNYIDQATKDADPIAYGGYYGDGDGVSTFTLPMIGGEFIRMFDDSRGVDDGRGFGSWSKASVIAVNDRYEGHIMSIESNSPSNLPLQRSIAGLDEALTKDYPNLRASYIATGSSNPNFLQDVGWGGGAVRPMSIAYYGKTRL